MPYVTSHPALDRQVAAPPPVCHPPLTCVYSQTGSPFGRRLHTRPYAPHASSRPCTQSAVRFAGPTPDAKHRPPTVDGFPSGQGLIVHARSSASYHPYPPTASPTQWSSPSCRPLPRTGVEPIPGRPSRGNPTGDRPRAPAQPREPPWTTGTHIYQENRYGHEVYSPVGLAHHH